VQCVCVFFHVCSKFEFLISQGSVATCLRCDGYCHMGFVRNFVRFPAVQKFWKSIKIWESYRQLKGGNFFETQCILVTAVSVFVCLSLAAFPHYCMDPDVTWGNGSGCALVVHCCYDNIAPNAKCQPVLVLALCLVYFLFIVRISVLGRCGLLLKVGVPWSVGHTDSPEGGTGKTCVGGGMHCYSPSRI